MVVTSLSLLLLIPGSIYGAVLALKWAYKIETRAAVFLLISWLLVSLLFSAVLIGIWILLFGVPVVTAS
jgi:hypothetical protein